MPAQFTGTFRVAATTPAWQAAGVVLRDRLREVEKLVKRCREETLLSAEAVHLLRGATRRADAAVAVFKGEIPSKQQRQLRKQLSRLRDAAGGVRDADVALDILRELASQVEGLTGLAQTIAGTEARRADETRVLERGVRRTNQRAIRRLRWSLIESLNDSANDQSAQLGAFARPAIDKAIARVRTAAARDLSDIANLHRLRMAVRKLRFTMEVLESCLPGASRFAASLHDVTHLLGRVNDLARVAAICEEIARSEPAGTCRSLPARFAIIRDRRHAHAVQFIQNLESSILAPLEAHLNATPRDPAVAVVRSPPMSRPASA